MFFVYLFKNASINKYTIIKQNNKCYFFTLKVGNYAIIKLMLGGVQMFLPNYTESISEDTKGYTTRRIIFDKLWVHIYGSAKYSRTEIKYHINPDVKKEDICLSWYMQAINDYLVNHPCYKEYKNRRVNVFDFSCVRFLYISDLKIDSDEFQIIRNTYPNIFSVTTIDCLIDKSACIGCLNCYYRDKRSTLTSLDSLQGFSGKILSLDETGVLSLNQNVLHLACEVLELEEVDLNYEYFFLTTCAPKVRRVDIHKKKKEECLGQKDLLFLSGFYNLEAISIDGEIENYREIQKLERLRKIERLLVTDKNALTMTKEKREKDILQMRDKGFTEKQIRHYIMFQTLVEKNKDCDFLHKLYVPRLERVLWEDKITTKELTRIREELIQIAKLDRKERKNISKEKKEETLFDTLNNLYFDSNPPKEEEYVLVDSRPFSFDMEDEKGIQYYIKNKKITVEE